MLRFNRILVPTDFSECSESALPWATRLARHYGAELHLLCSVPEREPDTWLELHDATDRAEVRSVLRRQAELQLRNRAAHLSVPAQAHVSTVQDSPGSAVSAYAEAHGINLIVMGTHGRRGFSRFHVGSVTEEVVRRAPCPVLTVRPETIDASAEAALDPILVPIDFSWYSRLTLAYAKALAADHGASLQLLHVINPKACPHVYLGKSEEATRDYHELELEAEERQRELLNESGARSVKDTVFVRCGNPAGEIVEFARSAGSGLILMASHGLGGLLRMMLGSVTSHVVHAAPCSVLVTRWSRVMTPGRDSLSTHYRSTGGEEPSKFGVAPIQ